MHPQKRRVRHEERDSIQAQLSYTVALEVRRESNDKQHAIARRM